MAAQTKGLGELSDQGGTLKLPDGRLLGFRSYGPEHGVPTFYFHGFPGSRLEAGLAAASELRLIAVDRPGYGLSDAHRGRTLKDWPADVAALADHLSIDRFGVLGISGGAPYALACAWALHERLSCVAIVCGLGPPEAEGMNQGMMRNALRLGRHGWQYTPLLWYARYFMTRKDAEQRFLAFRRRMSARLSAGVPKEAAISTDALSSHLFTSWSEGLRRSIAGVLSDARIYASRWPFQLSDVQMPIHLWHGTEDRMVPVAVGQHYARTLPRITASFEEGEGHCSVIFNAMPRVVRTLIDESRR
jgi:pimeloyl-ACP methyl ester carboxylesterase